MTGSHPRTTCTFGLLPVVEACVVVAVPGRVGEVRVAADEPEAVDQNKIAFNRDSRVFAVFSAPLRPSPDPRTPP